MSVNRHLRSSWGSCRNSTQNRLRLSSGNACTNDCEICTLLIALAGSPPLVAVRSKDVDALVLLGDKWTPHDLRRTAATTMAELGALPDVVEKCLNHVEAGKVKRIYQRAQYEGPMREAWRLLGSRLTLLRDMAAGRVTNVVPLQRVR